MLKFHDHIILDSIQSWPSEIIKTIHDSKEDLTNFLTEEYRISKQGHQDLSQKFKNRTNAFTRKWNETVVQIESLLRPHKIIGFHCTKLMDYEIKKVLKNGLTPLNREFANKRIDTVYNNGLISPQLREELINKPEYTDEKRNRLVCVFHCLSTLKNKEGLYKLLNLWGGEAIYSYVEDESELKEIGIPCIVVASANIDDLEIYPSLGDYMLRIFLTGEKYDPESSFNKKIDVLEIIERDNKLFNSLTNFDKW